VIRLPPPRPLLWPLRPLETAAVDDVVLDDGRRQITIDHALLRGVSPAMLDWWYHHVEGDMDYAGGRWPRYCVWHPLDHISYRVTGRRDGRVVPGTRVHIREAFQRKPENLLDLRAEVESIDARAAIIRKRVGPIVVLRLINSFDGVREGTRYRTQMIIGASGLAGRLLNGLLRRRILHGARGRAWMRHHVEEIGTLEHFLPGLFDREHALPAQATQAAVSRRDPITSDGGSRR
jgi:hypothetical protein